MTPVVRVPLAKFADGVVDIGGRFSTGVVDTPANLPPVSLMRISPQIFENIQNDPKVILRDLGEDDA
jgi:hypothetical protein